MIHGYLRPTPRQKKREATFERIIETAMRSLSKGGLDALTMQNLAGELGFAVGAVYRYFPGKDALIVAVQRRIIDTVRLELTQALGSVEAEISLSPELTPAQAALLRLWVAVRVYEAMAKTRPTEFGLLSMTLGDPRQLVKDADAQELAPAMVELFSVIGALFTAAAATDALAPGDALARSLVLFTSVQGTLQLKKLERFSLPALNSAALLDESVTTLLVGWGASAADSRAMKERAPRPRRTAAKQRKD